MLDKLKGCYKSVVIWFNAFALSLLSVFEMFHDSLSELMPFMSANAYKVLGLAIILGNIALRFKTSKPLQEK